MRIKIAGDAEEEAVVEAEVGVRLGGIATIDIGARNDNGGKTETSVRSGSCCVDGYSLRTGECESIGISALGQLPVFREDICDTFDRELRASNLISDAPIHCPYRDALLPAVTVCSN